MRVLIMYQNTKANGEDLALTPYLSLINYNGKTDKVFGIAICWFHEVIGIGLGFGIPKDYPTFKKY